MKKPNILGKRGMYGGFVCVILLRIAFELVFQFLSRRGLGVLRIIHRFSVFSGGSELERSQTGGPESRKAGKAQQLSPCWDASLPPVRRPGDLAGMGGGGTAAARGAEELWEQRPCSQGRAPLLLLSSPSSWCPFCVPP